MKDIQKFIALKKELSEERDQIKQRLSALNRALGEADGVAASVSQPAPPHRRAAHKRIKNPMPLRAAVIQVTKAKALTKQDILKAIAKVGYKFSAADPMNSLNAILYGNPKFKNQNGTFSPP